MPSWTRAVVAVVSCSTALLVPGSPAAAADCVTDDLGRLASRADVAFVGTTTQVAEDAVRLTVTDVYRGSPGPVVVLGVDEPGSSTGVDWRADRQYLVLAQEAGGTLETTACDGTREVDDATITAADAAFGPATPLGRGVDTPSPDGTASPSDGATPSAPTSDEAPASQDTSTSKLALGLGLGIVLAASFFLPQLRRHHRERRRGQR